MVCTDRYKMEADGARPPNYTTPGDIILGEHNKGPPGVSFTLYSILCDMVAPWRAHDK